MIPRKLLAPALAVFMLGIAAIAAPAAFADTFVVNATDDPSTGTCTTTHCSLRQAITASNNTNGPNTINFNLPESSFRCLIGRTLGVCHTTTPIQVSTALPPITMRVTIDGRTQPNFDTTPLVEVRGPGATSSVDGLVLKAGGTADRSIIRSLALTSFRNAVVIETSNSGVLGSRIGVDMSGAARANNQGVVVEGDNNQIGGSTGLGEGNVISGNTGDGVVVCFACLPGAQARLTGVSASNNLIIGNLIGTNPAGTAAMGNNNGVTIFGNGFNTLTNSFFDVPNRNVIGGGGLFADYGNVTSGNRASGIFVTGSVSTFIGGNSIGTNAAGTAAIPNTTAGITLQEAPNTFVGDFGIFSQPCTLLGRPASCPLDDGAPNTISGNTGDGIRVFMTTHTHDITIDSNFIGTDSSGVADLGNGANGINITGTGVLENNFDIGDNTSVGPNTIAFNGGAGILGRGNAVIRFNHIFSNDHLGIDHQLPTGTTDAPSVDSVTTNGTSIIVTGSVNHGLPGLTTDIVDVYVSDTCDGEGKNFVGTFNHTSSNVPDRGFIQTLNVPLAVGAAVTLTQTSADHGSDATTQFSACQFVTTGSQTGTFALTPRVTTTSVKTPLNANVVWTVPAPRVWRNLASIDVRLSTETGQTAFEVHWDEAANTFNLAGHPDAVAPGSNRRFESEWVSLDLSTATVVGSGPTGPSVTLTLPFTFKEHAAGHTFTLAIKGADDLGHQDAYLNTGTWQVAAR